MNPKFVTIFTICLFQIVSKAASFDEHIIDIHCNSESDCEEFRTSVVNATCISQSCICTNSKLEKIACFPREVLLSNKIGSKCPCSNIESSTCVKGLCLCKSDFEPSDDKRRCLPKQIPVGGLCENDAQCVNANSFARCVNQTCSCMPQFATHNGTCQSLVGLGDRCDSHSNCLIISNTLCSSQLCVCEPGFVAKFDKSACLPNADYNDECSESVQCLYHLGPGAVCEVGKCKCDENLVRVTFEIANETKSACEKRIVIGDHCIYDTDCNQSLIDGRELAMKCVSSKCECEDGYEQDRDSKYCIQSEKILLKSTWFDTAVMKVSKMFGSSSGCPTNSLHSLMVILCFVAALLFNFISFS